MGDIRYPYLTTITLATVYVAVRPINWADALENALHRLQHGSDVPQAAIVVGCLCVTIIGDMITHSKTSKRRRPRDMDAHLNTSEDARACSKAPAQGCSRAKAKKRKARISFSFSWDYNSEKNE
jgi:hypothetical protein